MITLKNLFTTVLLLVSGFAISQTITDAGTKQQESFVKGVVINAKDGKPLDNVNIVNLNQLKGSISNNSGTFKISAAVNDTLFFSYLGFETINVPVTSDWLKFGEVTIAMTERSIALEQVVINESKLTGYLEIDAKRAPIYTTRRYSISGLPQAYEAGTGSSSAITRVLGSIFNPADFLYNVFGKKGASMRKLRKIKEQDELRTLLQSKFDRETIVNLLQMDKVSIEAILRNCDYSKEFIENSNDLQILDAISGCYEQYKILKRNR
jgi:hypothetical protein